MQHKFEFLQGKKYKFSFNILYFGFINYYLFTFYEAYFGDPPQSKSYC